AGRGGTDAPAESGRETARTDRAGTSDPGTPRRAAVGSRDRRRAVHQSADGQAPRREHPREVGRRFPAGGGRDRGAPWRASRGQIATTRVAVTYTHWVYSSQGPSQKYNPRDHALSGTSSHTAGGIPESFPYPC